MYLPLSMVTDLIIIVSPATEAGDRHETGLCAGLDQPGRHHDETTTV